MGLLTFSINVTLDGCIDHQEGIADDETHAFFTRLMDESGAMLWGGAAYNNGIVPLKNYIFGEAYTESGQPASSSPSALPRSSQ